MTDIILTFEEILAELHSRVIDISQGFIWSTSAPRANIGVSCSDVRVVFFPRVRVQIGSGTETSERLPAHLSVLAGKLICVMNSLYNSSSAISIGVRVSSSPSLSLECGEMCEKKVNRADREKGVRERENEDRTTVTTQTETSRLMHVSGVHHVLVFLSGMSMKRRDRLLCPLKPDIVFA